MAKRGRRKMGEAEKAKKITVWIPPTLLGQLEARYGRPGDTPAEMLRRALASSLAPEQRPS